MDNQSMFSLLFFLVLYLVVGLLLVWFMHRPRAVKPDAAMGESDDDVYVEPGTFGKQPNYSVIALMDQVDALLASRLDRMSDAEMDEVSEEMQRRGW